MIAYPSWSSSGPVRSASDRTSRSDAPTFHESIANRDGAIAIRFPRRRMAATNGNTLADASASVRSPIVPAWLATMSPSVGRLGANAVPGRVCSTVHRSPGPSSATKRTASRRSNPMLWRSDGAARRKMPGSGTATRGG